MRFGCDGDSLADLLFQGVGEVWSEKKKDTKTDEKKEETKTEEPKTEEPKTQPKKEEPLIQELKLDGKFLRDASTVPSKITVKDLVIYKTITLKNTGNVEWPRSVFLTPVNEIKGQKTKLVNLGPGKEMSAIVVIESPCAPGEFASCWRLAYTNEKNETVFIGEEFHLEFKVEVPETKKEEPKEEPKKEEPKKVEETKKQYPEKVKKAAATLIELFPEANHANLLDAINDHPELSMEEIIENYLLSQ